MNANAIHLFSGPRDVIGTLKAVNSKDPDVLYASVSTVELQAKWFTIMTWAVTIVGALTCLTIIGAIFGIPMILLSWWGRKKIKKQKALIQQTYDEFLRTNGVAAVAA